MPKTKGLDIVGFQFKPKSISSVLINCWFVYLEETVDSPETPQVNAPVMTEIAQGGGEAPACEAEVAYIVSRHLTCRGLVRAQNVINADLICLQSIYSDCAFS